MTEFLDDNHAGLLYRGVKVLDIGYTGLLYFTIGAGIMMGLNMAIPGPKTTVSTGQLIGEILGLSMILPLVSYITRNLVQAIGSPFNGVAGLRHNRLYEVATGGVILTFALILTFTALVERVTLLQTRVSAMKQKHNKK